MAIVSIMGERSWARNAKPYTASEVSVLAPIDARLDTRPEWQLAERIAASKGLSKSEFLPRFLLYVCEMSLLDRAQEVTEQRIGIEIFHRPLGYNPGEDNIVRSYARVLRKRLDQYFKEEGAQETLRLEIPRGGYVPVFSANASREEPVRSDRPVDLSISDEALPAAIKPSRGRINWISLGLGAALGLILATLAWLTATLLQRRHHQPAAHPIWAQLFQRDRNTIIVPTDSGLGILENLSHHLVNLDEYANGSYLSDTEVPPGLDEGSFNDIRRERYTSVVSLDITSMLIRLPEVNQSRTQVRYARAITAEDLQNANAILIGSKHTNPWVSLFEDRLNFRLEFNSRVDDSYILNLHPQAGEQKIYRNSSGLSSDQTYGTIAWLPGLNGVGHVLLVEGLNMAATQAAADTLFESRLIGPVLHQATARDGSVRSFEILIATSSVGASSPSAQVLATRIYPQ